MSGIACPICARQARSGEYIYVSDHWVLRHSSETDILGYLVLESSRHILDMSEASADECASLGQVMKLAVGAIRASVDCERVYSVTLAEVVPHFHVHLIPRTPSLPRAYRGRGVLAYPLLPAADPALVESTCERLRAAIRRLSPALPA